MGKGNLGLRASFFKICLRQFAMKKICVTGGNGLLGSKLLTAACRKYRLVSIDLQESPLFQCDDLEYVQGDITDRDVIISQIVQFHPDCVIHTAAFTNVDGCEKEKDKAWKVNVSGAENVALACRDLKIKMIHISTDYVFDGKNGPYSETDRPNPISFYGKTKLESEKRIRETVEDSVIARTMVLYGYFPGVRMNFVTWLINKLRSSEKVNIVTDQYGTPTLADDLARALIILFEKEAQGLYNAAGSELINRYDFALRIAEIFDLDSSLIEKATSDHLKQPAPRPLQSGLLVDKICSEMGVHFSSVREGLSLIHI